MIEMKKILKCDHCGNIISMIKDKGPKVQCCGDSMRDMVANTVEAALEKHVPVANRVGNNLTVTVGSVMHPMTIEHHIAWIMVVQENKTQRVILDPVAAPVANFILNDGPVATYAYCNLHGLWKAED